MIFSRQATEEHYLLRRTQLHIARALAARRRSHARFYSRLVASLTPNWPPACNRYELDFRQLLPNLIGDIAEPLRQEENAEAEFSLITGSFSAADPEASGGSADGVLAQGHQTTVALQSGAKFLAKRSFTGCV